MWKQLHSSLLTHIGFCSTTSNFPQSSNWANACCLDQESSLSVQLDISNDVFLSYELFFFFNKHTWGYLVKTPQASSPCGIFSPAKESDLNSCLQHSGSSNGTGITSFLPFNQVNDKGIRSWVFSSCWQSRASTIIHHFIKNIP